MRLARKMIAKFCQKVKDTLNQDRITPSNHASNRSPATTKTITPNTTPRAVEVFIDQIDSVTSLAPLNLDRALLFLVSTPVTTAT